MARLTDRFGVAESTVYIGLLKSIPCAECGHVCSAVSERALARFIVDHCQYDLFKFAAEAMGSRVVKSER